MVTTSARVIAILAAMFGAPIWVAVLIAGALIADIYRQHNIAAEHFAAKHPGHVLTLDPWQPVSVTLVSTGLAFAFGLAARDVALAVF